MVEPYGPSRAASAIVQSSSPIVIRWGCRMAEPYGSSPATSAIVPSSPPTVLRGDCLMAEPYGSSRAISAFALSSCPIVTWGGCRMVEPYSSSLATSAIVQLSSLVMPHVGCQQVEPGMSSKPACVAAGSAPHGPGARAWPATGVSVICVLGWSARSCMRHGCARLARRGGTCRLGNCQPTHAYHWHISMRAWQRLQHALHGNTCGGAATGADGMPRAEAGGALGVVAIFADAPAQPGVAEPTWPSPRRSSPRLRAGRLAAGTPGAASPRAGSPSAAGAAGAARAPLGQTAPQRPAGVAGPRVPGAMAGGKRPALPDIRAATPQLGMGGALRRGPLSPLRAQCSELCAYNCRHCTARRHGERGERFAQPLPPMPKQSTAFARSTVWGGKVAKTDALLSTLRKAHRELHLHQRVSDETRAGVFGLAWKEAKNLGIPLCARGMLDLEARAKRAKAEYDQLLSRYADGGPACDDDLPDVDPSGTRLVLYYVADCEGLEIDLKDGAAVGAAAKLRAELLGVALEGLTLPRDSALSRFECAEADQRGRDPWLPAQAMAGRMRHVSGDRGAVTRAAEQARIERGGAVARQSDWVVANVRARLDPAGDGDVTGGDDGDGAEAQGGRRGGEGVPRAASTSDSSGGGGAGLLIMAMPLHQKCLLPRDALELIAVRCAPVLMRVLAAYTRELHGFAEAEESPQDWWVAALHDRVVTAARADDDGMPLGGADACGIDVGDEANGSAPPVVAGALASTLVHSHIIPEGMQRAPAAYRWVTWLAGRLAGAMPDGMAWRRMAIAGAHVHHCAAIPWQLLYACMAHCLQADPCQGIAPALSLGQAFGHDKAGLLRRLRHDEVALPVFGAQLRAAGLLSPHDVHVWVKQVAETHAAAKTDALRHGVPRLPRSEPRDMPGAAAETQAGLHYARSELARLSAIELDRKGAALDPPVAVAEVRHERLIFAWNPCGIGVTDARVARRSSRDVRRSVQDANGMAAALQRDMQEADAGDSSTGNGSAMKHKGCDSLEAAITHAKEHKAAAFMLNETHVKGVARDAVADYIAMRLNWRVQRKASLWKGAVPEYDPCVLQSCAVGDEHMGVLFAYDPDVMEVITHREVVPGRVLHVEVRMLDDALRYDLFVVYMPDRNKPADVHEEAWNWLTEAIITCEHTVVVAGDCNAETARRLKKAGVDLSKGAAPKRPGEAYMYKLMHGVVLEDPLKRLGKETTTFRHILHAPTETEPEVVGTHVIDHVLYNGVATRLKAGGARTLQSGQRQFHQAVAFYIITVAAEPIKFKSTLKPRLSRMPAQPPRSRRNVQSLAKRAAARARELPEHAVDQWGELIDEEEDFSGDSECEDTGEDEKGEPIGWELYKLVVVDEVAEDLKDYVASRNMAIATAILGLGSDGTIADREAAEADARRAFVVQQGTATDVAMRTAMRMAREVINVELPSGRQQTLHETRRRRLEFYVRIESEVDDLDANLINFRCTGRIPVRWLAKSEVLDDGLRDLFDGMSSVVTPAARKARELQLIRALLKQSQMDFDEMYAEGRLDYALELAQEAAIKEFGFTQAVSNVLKRERPGVISKKDRGPGNQLTALRDDDDPELLLTGAQCDEAVAAKVEAGNRPKLVDLEAVGHLMDCTAFVRGETRGGPNSRISGACMQHAEAHESLRRQERFQRRQALRDRVRMPPPGAYVVVGNAGRPDPEHAGRVHLMASRGTILGNPFRMGIDGRDERWRSTVCACYREWLNTGGDAYQIAERHGLPLDMVSVGGGCISAQDIQAELDAVVKIVAELQHRVVLLCHCTPEQCHLDEIARVCNLRIAQVLEARSEPDADGLVSSASAAMADAPLYLPPDTNGGGGGGAAAMRRRAAATAAPMIDELVPFMSAQPVAFYYVPGDDTVGGSA